MGGVGRAISNFCLTIDAIHTEVRLLRQMMLNAIGHDLGNHYQTVMPDTLSARQAYRTVLTHTSYRRRAKCPAVLYDEAKTTSVARAGGIAFEMRSRFLGKIVGHGPNAINLEGACLSFSIGGPSQLHMQDH